MVFNGPLHPYCLDAASTCLVIIDIQERFRKAVEGFDAIAHNAATLVHGFSMLDLPVIITEQYPKGLGPTVDPVKQSFTQWAPVEKTAFSCTLCDAFINRLEALNPKTIVVCGIETHVCVNQTVLGLLHKGYAVHVVTDAVASRKKNDHETALRKMEKAGAIPATVEICLFELLKRADAHHFKNIQELIK